MSFNLNRVILGGRLTANPELKVTPSGTNVTTFTIAVDRSTRYKDSDGNKITDFISVVAWQKTAEFVCKHFVKGSQICVEGEWQVRVWKAQDGTNRYANECVAHDVFFVDNASSSQQQQIDPTDGANFTPVNSDEDLPF